MARLWIWGCGELGTRVGQKWIASGQPCTALTATRERHKNLVQLGFDVSISQPDGFEADDFLLICVPGTPRLQQVVENIKNSAVPRRVVLTSSTGYYHGVGGPIDSNTPPGSTPRAQEIATMEQSFLRWAGERGVILRLGGLYRPGRGPLNALKNRGAPPAGVGDKTLALIHYDDAAQAAYAALNHPQPDRAYIGVNPPCPTRREFYLAASIILDLNLPSFGRNSGEPPAQYQVDSLKTDLLPNPQYPKWQAALVP